MSVAGIGWLWACATLWMCWIESTRGTATAAEAAARRVERINVNCMASGGKMGERLGMSTTGKAVCVKACGRWN